MKQELGPLQKKWMEALRAHPERQTIGRLGKIFKEGEKMCCLGQGGLIAGVCEWRGDVLTTRDGATGCLLGSAYTALGLRSDNGGAIGDEPDLSALNDAGTSWPQIADIIESDPSVYFTHAV